MFCSKCGAEIHDEAIICPKCGCQTKNQILKKVSEPSEDNVSGGIIVISILLPIVGVIVGIVNLCKNKIKSGLIYLSISIIAGVIWYLINSLL